MTLDAAESSLPGAALVGNADAFPVLNHWRFFNHGGVCPLPAVAANAFREYAREASTGGYLGTSWYGRLETLRRRLAGMIGGHRDEIALLKNTSEGLGLLAAGLDFQAGDRIVTSAVEYPSNMYPWMDLQRRKGVELVMVPERVRADGTAAVEEAELLAALDHPRARMLAISHGQYASGQRMDLTTLGAFCRPRGIWFCVDAIQTAGILPIDVVGMNIDFLAADGHKWLLGPEGAGFLYVRRGMLERVTPVVLGWNSVINPQDYGDYDLTLKPDASRFECGTLTIPAFLALLASVELLQAAGGAFVGGRIKGLGDRLIGGARRQGWTCVSPREAERWSGGVALVKAGVELKAVALRLRKEHGIEVAVREGRLRATPHFYNTEAEIDQLLAVLE